MIRNPPLLGTAEQVVRTVFGCATEDIAPSVVLSPFVPLKSFRRHLSTVTAELTPAFFYKGVTGVFAGQPVTILHTGVGPSRIGDCLAFLSLTPARQVCFAGAVGALNAQYSIGAFCIPTVVADGEGYSHYCRAPFAELAAAAPVVTCAAAGGDHWQSLLAAEALPLHHSRVFTIGSIAFESPENLRTLLALGYDAVEMELSAFYAAAAYHGLLAAALTYVSDLPLSRSLWQEKTPAEEEALRRAYRALPLLALRRAAEPAAP